MKTVRGRQRNAVVMIFVQCIEQGVPGMRAAALTFQAKLKGKVLVLGCLYISVKALQIPTL